MLLDLGKILIVKMLLAVYPLVMRRDLSVAVSNKPTPNSCLLQSGTKTQCSKWERNTLQSLKISFRLDSDFPAYIARTLIEIGERAGEESSLMLSGSLCTF